jgi:Flp pilus assembly protein TadD
MNLLFKFFGFRGYRLLRRPSAKVIVIFAVSTFSGTCLARAADSDSASSASELKRQCELGDFQVCRTYGVQAAKLERWQEALDALKKACSVHDERACGAAGLVADKLGDKVSARNFFQQACNFGSGMACLELANLESGGKPEPTDPLVLKACQFGEGYACYLIGESYRMSGQTDIAINYLSRSCDVDEPVACYEYALVLEKRGRTAEAIRIHQANCASKSDSCVAAGLLLLKQGDSEAALRACQPVCLSNKGAGNACICQGLAEIELYGMAKGQKTVDDACSKKWVNACGAVANKRRF